jgi:hypothetical protein
MIQLTAGQQSEAVLDGGSALLLILVVADVLLECLDDDFLLGPAATNVHSALEQVMGPLDVSGGCHLLPLLLLRLNGCSGQRAMSFSVLLDPCLSSSRSGETVSIGRSSHA